KYGLKAPEIKATLKVKAKGKDDQKPEDWVYLFGKGTEDKNGVYAKQEKHDLVFVGPAQVLTILRNDLLDTTVFAFDVAKVKELKITGWKPVNKFTTVLQMERKATNTWAMKMPPDFNLDGNQAEVFVGGLANLKADRFVLLKGGPKPEHKLDPKEALMQIEITLEGEKEPVTLTLGDLSSKDKAYYAQSNKLPGMVFLLAEEPSLGKPGVNWKEVLKTHNYFGKPTEAGK